MDSSRGSSFLVSSLPHVRIEAVYDPEDPAEDTQPHLGFTAYFLNVSAIQGQGRKDDDWHASLPYANIF